MTFITLARETISHPVLGFLLAICALIGGFLEVANEYLDVFLSLFGFVLLCMNIYYTYLKIRDMRAKKAVKVNDNSKTETVE